VASTAELRVAICASLICSDGGGSFQIQTMFLFATVVTLKPRVLIVKASFPRQNLRHKTDDDVNLWTWLIIYK
jgi:hypothetical protein